MRREQHEEREELKPSRYHQKCQNDLGEIREHREVIRRANHTEARSDISDSCEHSCECRDKIKAVQRYQEHAHCDNDYIKENEICDICNDFLLDRAAIDFDSIYSVRMYLKTDAAADQLEAYQDPQDFDTASGR